MHTFAYTLATSYSFSVFNELPIPSCLQYAAEFPLKHDLGRKVIHKQNDPIILERFMQMPIQNFPKLIVDRESGGNVSHGTSLIETFRTSLQPYILNTFLITLNHWIHGKHDVPLSLGQSETCFKQWVNRCVFFLLMVYCPRKGTMTPWLSLLLYQPQAEASAWLLAFSNVSAANPPLRDRPCVNNCHCCRRPSIHPNDVLWKQADMSLMKDTRFYCMKLVSSKNIHPTFCKHTQPWQPSRAVVTLMNREIVGPGSQRHFLVFV